MINIKNLSYRYSGAASLALQAIDLTIEKASLFGLLGPNGAGKTTLISLLTGILRADSGHIVINGLELPESGKQARRLMGYVPQDYAFYPDLTALENLQFFAGVQGLKGTDVKKRIDYCLEFCQLQSVARQRAGTFSGGLKRRLNIAIGLLSDPEIVIFDEPTVSIDPHSRAFILQQIKALQQQGKTIIYTSHYMEEVEQLCEDIAIIDHGQLLKQGSLQAMQQGYQQVVLNSKAPISQSCVDILSKQFKLSCDKQQIIFHDIATMTDYHKVIASTERLNLDIASVYYGKANLEQIFLDLTCKQLRD